MANVPVSCPNCKKNVVIDNTMTNSTCNYCNLTFNVNQAISSYIKTNNNISDFEIINGVLKKYNNTSSSVNIPNNVTKIGENAFRKCSKLKYINIPNNVTEIDDNAFEGCSNLQAINLPNSITRIGECAFWGCSNLQAITISNSIKTIEAFTFAGCSSLKNIDIPDGVEEIKPYAFLKCSGLIYINLPVSVTTIESGVFRECFSLDSLTIPNNVTHLSSSAFDKCSEHLVFNNNNLKRFNIPLINRRKNKGKCLSCGGEITIWGRKCKNCGRYN